MRPRVRCFKGCGRAGDIASLAGPICLRCWMKNWKKAVKIMREIV